MSESSFVNSARRLYLSSGGSTPTHTHIPTLVLEEMPGTREETWFSSADVVNGAAHENGAVTAQSMGYRVETKMFKTADATSQLNAALKTIKDCKNASGADVRKNFVIVEPDGDMWAVTCDVLNVVTLRGKTEDAAAMIFDLKRRGAPAAYTGELE